jgi:type I restriction enzyme S subunit
LGGLKSPGDYATFKFLPPSRHDQGSSRDFLNQSILQSIIFPICGLAEQTEVISQIDDKLSNLEKLLDEIETNLLRINALRQSILKKAHSGQLVAQDQDDEPASILLERIKAKKEEQVNGRKKNKRRDAA